MKIMTFAHVLENIESFSTRCWIYLPSDDEWSLESNSAVLESEEVLPEEEDDLEAGVPEFAKKNKLMRALPVSEVQDIVRNLKEQLPTASLDQAFEAFLYYYDNDSYISV